MILIGSGSRLSQWDSEAFIGVTCPCGKKRTHKIDNLKRGMPATFQLEHMIEDMRRSCEIRPGACEAELIFPDDGTDTAG